ncbi:MAG: hypothetical protein EBW44_00435 [Rhodobacteraceae bacterium]|nr:hypothetical protein [Paracoccaceae bacterium]
MLGVVNKAIEAFVCQRYGDKLWADLLIDLSLPGYEFEAMLTYEDGITYDLIDRLAKRQSKMHQDVLEDIGGYLVAEDSQASIRRLYDLNDRVALALDILEMPMIRVLPISAEKIHVRVAPKWLGFSDVLVGLLRALADDYGALVFMDRLADTDQTECIVLILIDHHHTAGTSFELAASS